MNLLIVEDELSIANSIKRNFSKSSEFAKIEIAGSFVEAIGMMNKYTFEIIIVDINLDGSELDGLDLCDLIRNQNNRVPIIVITACHTLKNMERAFSIGVNDYVTKPFNIKELEIRVKRWSTSISPGSLKSSLEYGKLRYDLKNKAFYFGNNKLELTKKNKELLLIFMEEPENLLTHEYIKEKYWGDYSLTRKSRNLRSSIQHLRDALEGVCSEWILTVRGEGYILNKNHDEENSDNRG